MVPERHSVELTVLTNWPSAQNTGEGGRLAELGERLRCIRIVWVTIELQEEQVVPGLRA